MSGSLRRATAFRAFQACRSLRPPPSRTTPPSTTSTVVRGSLSQFRLSARAFRRERKRPFLDPGASPLSESLSERPVSPFPTPLVLLPGCMLLGAPECEGLTKSRRKASGLQQWGYKAVPVLISINILARDADLWYKSTGSLKTWCCRLRGEGPLVKHQPHAR